MMKLFIVALYFLPGVLSNNYWKEFENYIRKHNRFFDTIEDFKYRFEVFSENMKFIEHHNSLELNSTLGLTPFTDFTHEEYKNKLFRFRGPLFNKCSKFELNENNLPNSWDWRNKNAVTDVKDQGQCGSCWSFSATGAMEGAWSISNNELISLSEQQLVDCSSSYGNHGCHGGLMDGAFEYVMDNGICSEEEYGYVAKKGNCEQCTTVVELTGCSDVQPNNEMVLKNAVHGTPVSVAIEADTREFQLYKSGVITGDSCGTNLDHGVLIVGYGEDKGVKYWLVKNSWSTSWGDNGYVKIERTDSTSTPGVCGIASQPSFPIV